MTRQLTPAEYRCACHLLRSGFRHTEVARELNLSMWTVARIDRDRRQGIKELAEGETLEDDGPPDYVARNLRRCPGCGAMIYIWPCLACRMSMTAHLHLPPAAEEDEEEDDGPVEHSVLREPEPCE